MFDTTTHRPDGACEYCSSHGQWTVHTGKCPKVKSIEYYPNRTVKRVEFFDAPLDVTVSFEPQWDDFVMPTWDDDMPDFRRDLSRSEEE